MAKRRTAFVRSGKETPPSYDEEEDANLATALLATSRKKSGALSFPAGEP
jgi:hypothetical protein